MNVVMAKATALLHKRAGNDDMAANSERTSARATILAKSMWDRLPNLRASFAALTEAVASEFLVEAPEQEPEVDEWVAFLMRWQYDEEQLQIISDSLSALQESVGGAAEE